MKKIIFIIFLLAMSVNANCQGIDSIKYSPLNPHTGDTISLFCYVWYPNLGCPLTYKTWYFGYDNSVFLEAFHCVVGMQPILCYTTDTFKVVIPIGHPNVYTFYYMPGFDHTSPCQFPINVYGDTLPYPSSISSIQINVTNPSGISEVSNSNSIFKIFPNPVIDNLTIETNQQATIEITNIEGELIQTLATTSNKTTVDVSALAKGMYFIKIETEKGVAVKKFIKE